MKLKNILQKTSLILQSLAVDLTVVAYAFKADWKDQPLLCTAILALLITGARNVDFRIWLRFSRLQNRIRRDSRKDNTEKKVYEILAKNGRSLIDLKIRGCEAKVTFALSSLLDITPSEELKDYSQTHYFQDNEKCGYYSSCGFGSDLREYRDGQMSELMSGMEKEILKTLPEGITSIVFENRFPEGNT